LVASVGFGGGAVESVGDVRLKGYLGDRLDLMINNHVVKRDVDYITSLFSSKSETRYWWQTGDYRVKYVLRLTLLAPVGSWDYC
jgi:hypothetical protein